MDDKIDILNWRQFDDNITTSGQPTAEQIEELKRTGIKTVINLGPHEHKDALPEEGSLVLAQGMKYVYIPVAFDAPSQSDYEKFLSVLQQSQNNPIHVHCIFNARVTAFLYKYACDSNQGNEVQARSIMESVWRPGGVWAEFIGDAQRISSGHDYAGLNY